MQIFDVLLNREIAEVMKVKIIGKSEARKQANGNVVTALATSSSRQIQKKTEKKKRMS